MSQAVYLLLCFSVVFFFALSLKRPPEALTSTPCLGACASIDCAVASFVQCEPRDAVLQKTDRKREGKKNGVKKRSKKRVIFLPSIPRGIAAGLFTRVATFHFLLCIFVCVCVRARVSASVRLCVACMCELCEGLAPRW